MLLKIIGVVVLIAILAGAGYWYFYLRVVETPPQTTMIERTVEGTVVRVDNERRSITVKEKSDKEVVLGIESGATVLDENGNIIPASYVRPGFSIRAEAAVDEAKASGTAKAVTLTEAANIAVITPQPQETVGPVIHLTGISRTFENNVLYRVRDADGKEIAKGYMTAEGPDIGQFATFWQEINYQMPKGDHGTIEVYEGSAKDGSEINKVIVPVIFDKSAQSMSIKLFFGKAGESDTDCSKVFAVTRNVPKTSAPLRTALDELLKGPTSAEKHDYYFTSINPGVTIQKLSIDDKGVAYADFSKILEESVGGSCRVTNIRAQITKTMMQFSTVKKAVISVDGRTEDILQP